MYGPFGNRLQQASISCFTVARGKEVSRYVERLSLLNRSVSNSVRLRLPTCFTFTAGKSGSNKSSATKHISFALTLILLTASMFLHSTAQATKDDGQGEFTAYSVSTGNEFQAALNAASPGDTITLQTGATLRGNFVLPKKKGSNWITIRTASLDQLPPENTRVSQDHAAAMARLESPNVEPVVRTERGAHHYRFIGIEFTIAPNVMLNYGLVRLGDGNETSASQLPHDLVFDRCYIHGHATSDVSRGIALNSASTDVVNSRISEIHGIGFDTQAIAGWNGPGPFKIINNYLEAAGENVLFGGADPKIPQLVPSDIEFRYNHCAKPVSWKQGILEKPASVVANAAMSSGALSAGATYYYRIAAQGRAGYSSTATSAASGEITTTLSSSGTAVSLAWSPVVGATEYRVFRTMDGPNASSRQWTYYKTTSASFTDTGDSESARTDSSPQNTGTLWSVKNLFELKNARNVIIEGNLFENNWVEAQSGFAIQLTVRNQDGGANWSVIEDVIFADNIVRHAAGGMNLLGRDYNYPSQQMQRVSIVGNLFYDVGGNRWGDNGRFLQITETVDVRVDQNTVMQTSNLISAYGVPNQRFVFTNNIAPHNDYGIFGAGSSAGNQTIDQYFPGTKLKKNVIVGAQASRYPKKNFYPAALDDVGFMDRGNGNFKLADWSPYKNAGTKSKDIGVDYSKIEQVARRAVEGRP